MANSSVVEHLTDPKTERQIEGCGHTPSNAFWHLPPNSGRIGYDTKGARFISMQLSTDMVRALKKIWVLIRPSTHVNMRHIHPEYKNKEFHLDSNDLGFICVGLSNMVSYKRNIWCNLSCLFQTYCHLNVIQKLFVS